MFQSLFYWIYFCNNTTTSMSGDKNGVSILVLLDILLQLNIPQYPSQHHYRFNPCFIGYTSATGKHEFHPVDLTGWFQSLFYWIYFCNATTRDGRVYTTTVSILVLLDILLQHKLSEEYIPLWDKFQSLFYWIYFCNRGDKRELSPYRRYIVSILVLLDILLQQSLKFPLFGEKIIKNSSFIEVCVRMCNSTFIL